MTAPSDPGGLQFDKVAGASPAGAMHCVKCGKLIVGTYYELRGKALCESCAAEINAQIAAHFARGRSGEAFGKAVVFGVGGAILGAVAYYLITVATGWELAIVALAIGYLVGRGIQLAAKGVGGRRYQVLAVVLTYLAIGAAYGMLALRRDTDAGIGLMIFLTIAGPILVIVRSGVSGILSAIIIFVGLRTAWQMTAGATVLLKGPFRVGSAPVTR